MKVKSKSHIFTKLGISSMFIKRRMNAKSVVYSTNRIFHSNEMYKPQLCVNIMGMTKYYAELKKQTQRSSHYVILATFQKQVKPINGDGSQNRKMATFSRD